MKYSEKIKNLLENNSIDLKILLEEDENSEEEQESSESLDDMFSSLDKEEKDEDDSNTEDKEKEDDVIDKDTEDSKSLSPDNYNDLTRQIEDAKEKIAGKLKSIETSIVNQLQPTNDLNTDNLDYNDNNPYNKAEESDSSEDDIFESLTKENNYFKKSIKNFIFEEKENEDAISDDKFDDLEEKIKRLEKLTDLIDRKFNNPLNIITFEDVDKLVENAMYLIKTCDPVKYAYDETLKYLAIKSDKKEEEEIEEEFSLKFNKACEKEGYDASSITNISLEKNNNFKTSVNSNQGSS